MKQTLSVLICCLFLLACSNTNIDPLTKKIERIADNQLYFDCSVEVADSIKKTKNRNGIGYMCSVKVNEDTKLMDKNNQTLEITDFSLGDSIEFRINKKITERNRTFEVKEIILVK